MCGFFTSPTPIENGVFGPYTVRQHIQLFPEYHFGNRELDFAQGTALCEGARERSAFLTSRTLLFGIVFIFPCDINTWYIGFGGPFRDCLGGERRAQTPPT
jgi:hypothetical protein